VAEVLHPMGVAVLRLSEVVPQMSD
jgi:hypothetical protein